MKKSVRKTDGSVPSTASMSEAAETFQVPKNPVGRKEGWRKTTKAEDKKILKTFLKVRPPGHGIDSRRIHRALPKKVKKKICKKTVISRLAEKGYTPRMKLRKKDFGQNQLKKRDTFGKDHLSWTGQKWNSELQGVGDLSDFTWYPSDMRPRFKELRAPWTYMSDAERRQPAFQRPKQWFPKKEWKKVKKQTIFGLTTSNGKKLVFLVKKPWKSEDWAKMIEEKVTPFLKNAFPNRSSFTILLDGEKLLHAPVAKAAMVKGGIKVFPKWPGYSPDLNPQEHVWAFTEDEVRDVEKDNDTFEIFQQRLVTACRKYPADQAKKLVFGMAKRMQKLVDRKGGHIGK